MLFKLQGTFNLAFPRKYPINEPLANASNFPLNDYVGKQEYVQTILSQHSWQNIIFMEALIKLSRVKFSPFSHNVHRHTINT